MKRLYKIKLQRGVPFMDTFTYYVFSENDNLAEDRALGQAKLLPGSKDYTDQKIVLCERIIDGAFLE